MSEQRTSWLDRATGVVGLIAAVTAVLTWFVGDVPRVARLALVALAGAFFIFFRVSRGGGYRLLFASTPVLLFVTLVLVPPTRSWLLEQGNKAKPKGPALAIEDVRPSWGSASNSSGAQLFRVSIVVRNRASEPVVVNRALLGYHQGGGDVGGGADDIWLQDQALALHESKSEQTLEIRQSDDANDDFAVPVVAFARWFVNGVWDQVIELRPQATVPANSVRTLRVTMPLKMRLAVVRRHQGEDTEIERRKDELDFFVRFSQDQFDNFPRLLTVTVNTTNRGCATDITVLEPGKGKSAAPRSTAFLDKAVAFEELCGWSPPRPPA